VITSDWSIYYKKIAIQTVLRQLQAAKRLTYEFLNLFYNLMWTNILRSERYTSRKLIGHQAVIVFRNSGDNATCKAKRFSRTVLVTSKLVQPKANCIKYEQMTTK